MQGTFLWSVPQNNGSSLFGGLFSSLFRKIPGMVFLPGFFRKWCKGFSERQSGLLMEKISEGLPLNSSPLVFLQRILSSGEGVGC